MTLTPGLPDGSDPHDAQLTEVTLNSKVILAGNFLRDRRDCHSPVGWQSRYASDELLAGCCNGQITDAKTLAGILWLQNTLSGAWVLDWQFSEA